MKIAGFQKNSFIDFPGKIASVIFLGGCNMRCYYCHNYNILCSSSNTHDFANILPQIRDQLGFIDAVVVSGGEPTLYPHLEQLIREIKGMGLLVKLDTNGTNPRLMKKLVGEGLVDYVAMDIKAGPTKYDQITMVKNPMDKIRESIQFLIGQDNVNYMFRTTLAPILGADDMAEIAELIRGAKTYQIQQFVPNEFSNDQSVIMFPHTLAMAQGFADIIGESVGEVLLRGF
ncbi:MAG: anaerobic ribonucleoside-triphosphate reductase activating protein [Firmicutes bacterium]|nr:anaerobic ribonucleoside-triphosphate reductase activating protein [Bacillota bacterium]